MGRLKADFGVRNIVCGNHIEVFAHKLLACVFREVFGLRGKAHNALFLFPYTHGGENVARRLKGNRQCVFPVFLDFLLGNRFGRKVRRSRRHYKRVASVEAFINGTKHFIRRSHIHTFHTRRYRKRHRARNECNERAARRRGLGQRIAHFAA